MVFDSGMMVVVSSQCPLMGLQWEEHRKGSSEEVNGLLTQQDKGPGHVCAYVCATLMNASY